MSSCLAASSLTWHLPTAGWVIGAKGHGFFPIVFYTAEMAGKPPTIPPKGGWSTSNAVGTLPAPTIHWVLAQ